MAIDPTLGIAAHALIVDQAALGVVGNNIANVNTPGYTRQVPVLSAASELGGGTFHLDGGVLLQSVQQILDPFVAKRLLAAGSDAAQKSAVSTQLTALVSQLDDLGGSSLTTLLGGFFSAAATVSNQPQDTAARQGLLGAANALANEFNRRSAVIAQLQQNADAQIVGDASQANNDLVQIAQLNDDIARELAQGGQANGLRDQRQQVLTDLAQKIGITTQEDPTTGEVTVASAAGPVLVTAGTVVNAITTQPDPTNPATLGGNTLHKVVLQAPSGALVDVPAVFASGEIGGLQQVRDGDLFTASQNLDTLANALATAVNAVQTQPGAVDLNGNPTTGVPLFGGTTASTLTVLITDPSQVAAALSTQPGDNQNALALADLASAVQAPLGGTFSGYAASETARIGANAQQAQDLASASQGVLQQVQSQRDSLSGVNLNEELTNLLSFQHAFQASAQVISVVNSTLDDLMQIVT
ncbi:MAG TPA: flagellar hook-associated protein FlgK [Candidatus Binatia bacterium]|nr:flagellar hook-associated protein FlgK [Candidatus Binatia bacterium]